MNRVGEKYFHYSFNSTKDGSYAYGLSFTHQSVSPQQQTIFRFPRAAKDSDIFYIAAEIGKEIDTHKKISSKRAILDANGDVK